MIHIHLSNNQGKPTGIPRVDTTPHGVETVSSSAGGIFWVGPMEPALCGSLPFGHRRGPPKTGDDHIHATPESGILPYGFDSNNPH